MLSPIYKIVGFILQAIKLYRCNCIILQEIASKNRNSDKDKKKQA